MTSHLVPSVQDELELGGWGGIVIAQRLEGVLLGSLHLGSGLFLGLLILRPACVVVHVALQCMLGVLPSLCLFIVLALLLGRLIPAPRTSIPEPAFPGVL